MADSAGKRLFDEKERVYLELYGLSEPPFTITPDPDFLYLAQTHQEALEKILYTIGVRMGFMLLTGEVGTGKTTLCRHLLDRMHGQAETVYIVNPSLTGKELLASILDDLGIPYPARATKKNLLGLLNRFLLCPVFSKPVVIIIDDAQSMSTDALEQLRLLSNLETDKVKLLQILLVGQPELVELLNRADLRQLRQRIALHCELNLLTKEETAEYIHRRLFAAGSQGRLNFRKDAIKLVHQRSGGIPRLANKICDYALVAGYVDNEFTIAAKHVKIALRETGNLAPLSGSAWKLASDPSINRQRRLRGTLWLLASALIAVLASLGFGIYP